MSNYSICDNENNTLCVFNSYEGAMNALKLYRKDFVEANGLFIKSDKIKSEDDIKTFIKTEFAKIKAEVESSNCSDELKKNIHYELQEALENLGFANEYC